MACMGLHSGWRNLVCGVLLAVSVAPDAMAQPAETFPFDQPLLLNVAPMRPGKRMPGLTIERNGSATIDLWCRSVPARVEFSDSGVKIETAPLSEELPQIQGNGQCTPQRMAADAPLLDQFAQVTSWQRENGSLVLIGAERLKFSAPSN